MGCRETDSEWVFPSVRGGGPIRDIRSHIDAAFKKAKIADATPHHVFRHTFTTQAAEAGHGDMVIAAMVGHTLGSMTSRYGHLTVDGIVRAADEGVQKRLAAALAGRKKAPVAKLPSRA